MIEIKNLYKTYKNENQDIEAIRGIDLTIFDGEIFGIIGLSGAGKSSLVRCINMLEKPTIGSILIDGTDVTKLRSIALRNIRKKIGMIFQHFNLLSNSTVFENIAFPLRLSKIKEAEIKERTEYLLKVVELSDKKDFYPSQLSGGQKQRVGIARALANNPNILLSDEATSALDPATTESILNLLRQINKEFGITVIVITHEMNVVKHICSRIAVLDNGKVAECGNTIDIFQNRESDILKAFTTSENLPSSEDIIKNPESMLLKISFNPINSEKPVISQMVKRFNVDANILYGNLEKIQDSTFGTLYVSLTGSEEEKRKAVDYLVENKIFVEVITDEL